MDRRRFVSLIGAFRAGRVLTGSLNAQSKQINPPSYDEVRSKLSGTRLFVVPYGHNDYGWP